MEIDFQVLFVPLSAALGLSLIVERILEFAQNVLELFLRPQEGRQIPKTTTAEDMIRDLEELHQTDALMTELEIRAMEIREALGTETDNAKVEALTAELAELEAQGEWNEQASKYVILTESATDPDNGKNFKIFILQLAGFAAGIILARFSEVHLFQHFQIDGLTVPLWADFLLTGLLIGGGSAPIHTLIRFISARKISKSPAPVKTAPEIVEEAVASFGPSFINNARDDGWVPIPYDGGVDREILENVHKRRLRIDGVRKPVDPDTIIYHHTAMDSRSSFQNVVDVIKNRRTRSGGRWLTGYHCVVLADGSIHPFCRWDRYGNHAAGINIKSLGLAFNGNFEPNPNVPASNPDGRFGDLRPTEHQLKSGARVITLWSMLYDIDIDFESSILPHKVVSRTPKACPGGAFPYDELKHWVDFFRNQWENSDAIKEQIEAYKLKPYLYSVNRTEA